MKFNQYLLIAMAVAITCLYSSVISGGKKKNQRKKLQLPQKKTLALPIASHSMALRWERKMNLTEVNTVILRRLTLF